MDAELDDALLARKIAAGEDRDAEAALCRRWFPRIRAFGRLRLGSAEAAADLAQEVLVVVIRALREGRVAEPERLGAYVTGVSRNLAKDWKAAERRRTALLDRFGPTWFESVTPAPRIEQARLSDCLGKLTPRDRAVVVLTYYAGADGDAIGKDLGMSESNVRVTRFRALKQLSECIGGEP
jgi:RNA polymerase sigma-70 factor (ECF subfamily)